MSEVIQRTVADIEQLAADRGLKLILPMADELLVDIDSPISNSYVDRVRDALINNDLQFISVLETLSKGGRTHKYIKLDRCLEPTARIALQTMLGSDPVREVLSLLRILLGSEPEAVTAFFETQDQYFKVLAWRAELKRRSSGTFKA